MEAASLEELGQLAAQVQPMFGELNAGLRRGDAPERIGQRVVVPSTERTRPLLTPPGMTAGRSAALDGRH